MRKRYLPLLLLVVFAQGAIAQQDAPPVDVKSLLTLLKQLQEKNSTSSKAKVAQAIQTVNAAAASNSSAIDFYLEAIRVTSFEGQTMGQTQFQDWKKKNADKLKSKEMQSAIRFHLQYLALTLQRANGAKLKDLAPALVAYTNQVLAALNDVGGEEMMKKGVTDSLFVQWQGYGKMLEGLKNWETNPGNVDGIWAKDILPQLRFAKDPNLIGYWDARLQREAKGASESKRAFNADAFNLIAKPTLLWNRAQDMMVLGQRNRAIGEMFAVVKNYPGHPDNGAWIKQLTEILTGTNEPVVVADPDAVVEEGKGAKPGETPAAVVK